MSHTVHLEEVFAKCKETKEDVSGWKVFIFLPQNFTWRLFIAVTSIYLYFSRTLEYFYNLSYDKLIYLQILCNIFYFIDTVTSTLHTIMGKTRMLRHGRKRPVALLLVDYLSMIPFDTVYSFFFYNHNDDLVSSAIKALRINVCLRMYQVYIIFSETRYWVYRMSIFFMIVIIGISLVTVLITHAMSCLLFLSLKKETQEKCLKNTLKCIMEMELLVYSIISQNYMETSFMNPMKNSPTIIALYFMIGYFFTYGIMLPIIYFAIFSMLAELMSNANRENQLSFFIKNMRANKTIKDKIVKYFETVRKYGKGDRKPEAFSFLPRALQKSIFCDVHWDAFKHSEFLGGLTLGCKRSLSLVMKKEFVQPNTVILEPKRKKHYFLYLESGSIQIMAQENDTSPVVTFSGGTVFGEMNLFFQVESQVIMKTAKLCVIHFLHYEEFMKAMLKYPREMKSVMRKMRHRMTLARATFERKLKIYPYFVEDMSSVLEEMGNIKWIKQQFQAISDMQNVDHEQNKFEKYFSSPRHYQPLQTQLGHMSVHFSLMVVNSEVINKYESVCLRQKLPWLIDPSSNFLKVWKGFIVFTVFIMSVLYPVFIGWYPHLPQWFFNITIVISTIYIIDVCIYLVTAVTVQYAVTSKFSVVFVNKLENLSFYVDLIAALPLQLLMSYDEETKKPFILGLFLLNGFLKSYKLIIFLMTWNYKKSNKTLWRTTVKDFFLLSLCVYWTATLYKLMGVECVFYHCSDKDWYSNIAKEKKEELRNKVSIYIAIFLAVDIPHVLFESSTFISIMIYIFFYYVFRTVSLMIATECLAASETQRIQSLNYRKLLEYVDYFMRVRRVSGHIPKRVYDTLKFHWLYDRGDYMTAKNRIVDDIPRYLKKEMDRALLYQTLQLCPLFKSENEDFIHDLCRRSQPILLPANSVLITFGVQTMCFYVIHRGYVQINSFLPNDVYSNVGTPFVIGSGDVFPVIIAFNQIPSALTARTVTDCELIIFKMEDIISILIIHNVLKDVVESLKMADITPLIKAQPGLSKVDDAFNLPKVDFTKFKKWVLLQQIIKFTVYKKVISLHSKNYLRWEFFRTCIVIIGLLFWPFVYGVLREYEFEKKVLSIILMILEITFLVDFYVRMRVTYYNKKGIHVTHPVSTMVHYLTTSFVLDLVSFFPHLHMLYLMLTTDYYCTLNLYLIHMALRLVSLYRVVGLLHYLTNELEFSNQLDYLRYWLIAIIFLNIYANAVIVKKLTGSEIDGPEIPRSDSVFESYFIVSMTALKLIAKIDYPIKEVDIREVIFLVIFYFTGWGLELTNYAITMVSFLGSGKILSDYQYYLRSFLKFLSLERVEDIVVSEAVEYYEHTWSEMKGIDYNAIFSKFPNILHEDLLISVYRTTLSKVSCLSKANEAFYRIISRNVKEVYFRKGSVIIFANQVKSTIYFVHKGQCQVKNEVPVYLCKGSMIGDIKGTGFMIHKVIAKTHVVLLEISSQIFFNEMQNFIKTKMDFEEEVSKYKDYVKSPVTEEIENETEDLQPRSKNEEIPESEFEPILVGHSDKNKGTKEDAETLEKLATHGILHPKSLKTKIFKYIFLFDALLTVFLLPTFISMHSVAPITLIITYFLDFIWIIKIGITLRTAIVDSKTGIMSYNKKKIFKKYLYRFDGLIIDIIAVFPVEFFPFVRNLYLHRQHCFPYFYILRIFRFFHLWRFANQDKKRVAVNALYRWCVIVILKIAVMNIFVCLMLSLSKKRGWARGNCYMTWNTRQWNAIVDNYICVLNCYCGNNIETCSPENNLQVFVQALIILWGCFTKAALFSQAVVIIFRLRRSKCQIIMQLDEMEHYLVVRNVSPALLGRVKKYFIHLIDYCGEGGMPTFLKTAPDFIKFHVMSELYMHHLSGCFLFQDVNEKFLKQLSTRLERFIFFPGNYITRQGDVDQSMYFIHKGEIQCLEKDKEYITLERHVDMYSKDECFGIMQGLFNSYPHMYSYKARTLSEIMVLHKNAWEDMRRVYPNITKSIYERALKGERASGSHVQSK